MEEKPQSQESSPHRHDVLIKRTLVISHGELQLTPEQTANPPKFYERFGQSKEPRACASDGPDEDFWDTNEIRSTRYTWWNFLPKNLFEQVAPWIKPANFYFLCIAVLQSIKEVSTTQGRPAILLSLSFVIVVSAVKDAFEDYSRYVQDKEKNEAVYEVYRNRQWQVIPSKEILVGDMIKISADQRIPADVLLIVSGVTEGTHVFIDTKSLDGETNLKPKSVPPNILPVLRGSPVGINNLEAVLNCDAPNSDMREWNADLSVAQGARKERINLSVDHIVLAESVLKNVPWAIGCCVYVGEQTKLRMNMRATLISRYKTSTIFRLTKTCLGAMAVMQLVLCLFTGIASGVLQDDTAWYMGEQYPAAYSAFLQIWTWFIICKDFVPIALYVSLEMVQYFQAKVIGRDYAMSAPESEGSEKRLYARAQTSRLNEELAQVQYIFSDKTGTLTQNSMEFLKCVIGDTQYGSGTTEAGIIRKAKTQRQDVGAALDEFHDNQAKENKGPKHAHVDFNARNLLTAAVEKKDAFAIDFITCLALNNNIFPKIKEQDFKDPSKRPTLVMESSSPDETALACFAQYMNFELASRQGGVVKIRRGENEFPYRDLVQIPFTSKRKRMTVIVWPQNDVGDCVGNLKIYMKGADSYVKKYIDFKDSDAKVQNDRWNFYTEKLEEFGGESLRCLVLACSEQHPSWWFGEEGSEGGGLKDQYETVQRTLGSLEKNHESGACSAQCRLCEIENRIEEKASLKLLGVTAIEDKLQEGVPRALKNLLLAGIKVWVLTGDTVETAINIAVSCNLLEADMDEQGRLFRFDKLPTLEDISKKLEASFEVIRANSEAKFGIALHGDVWKKMLQQDTRAVLNRFCELASHCRSVIACRLEPKEKSDIVALMQAKEGVPCLAIGDGNNDTPMIRTADIGVGIRGVEGTSAVTAADYAISQFRFLTRLLFVHGRLNSRRTANLICYIFYKASFIVWTLLYFGMYSRFSGQFLYLDWAYQMQNTIFTSFPIIIFAIFDQDLDPEILEDHPQLYAFSRGPVDFSVSVFTRWLVLGFFQASIAFWVPWLGWDMSSPERNGQGYGAWAVGLVIYTCAILIIDLKLIFVFRFWTKAHKGTFWGSIIIYFIIMLLFAVTGNVGSLNLAIGGVDYYGVMTRLMGTARFWLTILLGVTLAVLLDLAVYANVHLFNPTIADLYYEAQLIDRESMKTWSPELITHAARGLSKWKGLGFDRRGWQPLPSEHALSLEGTVSPSSRGSPPPRDSASPGPPPVRAR